MINPKDITKNAVAICTFLELSIIDKRAKSNPKYSIPFSNITYIEHDPWGEDGYGDLEDGWIETETSIKASDTLFHSDWNWLMELVGKIEEYHPYQDLEIRGCRCYFNSHSAIDDCFTEWFEGETKIEAVYKGCIAFINWYNENIK
jgi:hypothetical protein